MACEEAEQLLAEYNSGVGDASKAEQGVANLAGTASWDDFKLLLEEKHRANARVKQAQAAYEQHIKNHCCGVRSAEQG
jgi:hypothetical protein